MNEAEFTEYDKVAYPSYTHPQTHPDRMSVVGTLFGLAPAPVTACRVLELGCGDATNLISMAWVLPQSQFVGVDLAAIPISKGQNLSRHLGLGNLRLVHGNLSEVDSRWGRFDYVIAHGLYSWVPKEVREQLLSLVRKLLTPNGIAFVSYNALPGFHLRNMLREMMLFHVRGFGSVDERVKQAMALVRFLANGQQTPDEYRLWLKAECERVLEHSQGHLHHDDLAGVNEAFYFSEFVEAARQHELQYLGEADFFEMSDDAFEDSTRQTLKELAQQRVLREQYLDFLKCRRFRQTLLCHAETQLLSQPAVERVAGFRICSAAACTEGPLDLHPGVLCVFETPKGAKCQTDLPVGKAAMAILEGVWPASLPFVELLERARHYLAEKEISIENPEVCRDVLSGFLLRLYGGGAVEFRTYQPPIAREISDRPVAHPLARWQAAHGDWVTSLFHIAVIIEDEIGRSLLTWLDGTLDRKELPERLWNFLKTKDLLRFQDGEELAARQEIDAKLEKKLQQLARLGLLVD